MTRLSLVLLIVVSACSKKKDAEPYAICTMVGCESGVELPLGTFAVADVTPSEAAKAQVEVCLNKQCSTIALATLPSGTETLAHDGAVVVPNVTMHASLSQPKQDAIDIVVHVNGPDTKSFKDGDVYHVTVKSADARVLADRSWSVAYTVHRPNGPKCEPECAQGTKKTAL